MLPNYSFFVIYLGFINFVAFTLFVADKFFATGNLWRIRERTLLFLALIGGSAGALIAMKLFRHKTRKSSFQAIFILILLLQLVAAVTYINFTRESPGEFYAL